MKDLEIIANEALKNIKKNLKEPTPREYRREFCNTLNTYDMTNEECEFFKNTLENLTEDEQEILNTSNNEDIEVLVELLLKRIAAKDVKNLVSVLRLALLPSINVNTIDEFENFTNKISKQPDLIFQRELQNKMEEFITKRFELDQSLLKEKTSNIAKLMAMMGDFLKEAIINTKNSSANVHNIKGELKSMNLKDANIKDLNILQDKLINAATNIETEIEQINDKLSTGKQSVTEMQAKINDLEHQLKAAKQEATYDHLTGLLTRRAFDKEIEVLDKKYKRDNFEYAIIFFDIDFFKKINDTYGHKGGDHVLRTFSKVLKSQTRDSDLLGRYGGEEFVATVEFKLRRELLQYLKRIKTIIKENSFNYENKKIQITFSAGVALRNNSETYDDAILKADELLYEAKNSGRDKIIMDDGTVI